MSRVSQARGSDNAAAQARARERAAELARQRALEAKRREEAAQRAAEEARRRAEQTQRQLEQARRQQAQMDRHGSPAAELEAQRARVAELETQTNQARAAAAQAQEHVRVTGQQALAAMNDANAAASAASRPAAFSPGDLQEMHLAAANQGRRWNDGTALGSAWSPTGAENATQVTADLTADSAFARLAQRSGVASGLSRFNITDSRELARFAGQLARQTVGAASDRRGDVPTPFLEQWQRYERENPEAAAAIMNEAATVLPEGERRTALLNRASHATQAAINNTDDGERHDDTALRTASTMADMLESAPAGRRAAMLEQLRPQLESLAPLVRHMNEEETGQFFEQLARMTDAVGPAQAGTVAAPFADSLGSGGVTESDSATRFRSEQQVINALQNDAVGGMETLRTAMAARLTANGETELATTVSSGASRASHLSEADAEAALAAQVATDAGSVQAAFDGAGTNQAQAALAAGTRLNELAEAHADEPEYLRALAHASLGVIDQIAHVYAANIESDAFGTGADKATMRQSVAALAAFASAAGPSAADEIAHAVAVAIPDSGELQEFDDGFYDYAESEHGDTLLFRAVFNELNALGKTRAATELENQEGGADLSEFSVEEFRARIEEADGDAAQIRQILQSQLPVVAQDLAMRVIENRNNGTNDTLALLAQVADDGGPDVAQQIAQALAHAIPNQSDLNEFDDALSSLAQEGRGVQLSTSIALELQATGKTEAAAELSDVVADGMHSLRNDLNHAIEEREAADAELQHQLSEFPFLEGPERAAFVADYKEEHSDVYEAEVRRTRDLETFLRTNVEAMGQLAVANDDVADEMMESMSALAESPRPEFALDWALDVLHADNPAHAAFSDRRDEMTDLVNHAMEGGLSAQLIGETLEEGGTMEEAIEKLEAIHSRIEQVHTALDLPENFAEASRELTRALRAVQTEGVAAIEDLITDSHKLEGFGAFSGSMAAGALAFSILSRPDDPSAAESLQQIAAISRDGAEVVRGTLNSLANSSRFAEVEGLQTAARGFDTIGARLIPGLALAVNAFATEQSIEDLQDGAEPGEVVALVGNAVATLGSVVEVVAGWTGVGEVAAKIIQGVGTGIALLGEGISGADDRRHFNDEQLRHLEAAYEGQAARLGFRDEDQLNEALRQMADSNQDLVQIKRDAGLSTNQLIQLMGTVPSANNRGMEELAQVARAVGLRGQAFVDKLRELNLSESDMIRFREEAGQLESLVSPSSEPPVNATDAELEAFQTERAADLAAQRQANAESLAAEFGLT